MAFEDITKFEKQSLSQLLVTLQKWFPETINNPVMEVRQHNCESGIWISIDLKMKGKKYNIGGSRIDVAKRRLIEFLDKHQLRAGLNVL
jgi:hypothetical protein